MLAGLATTLVSAPAQAAPAQAVPPHAASANAAPASTLVVSTDRVLRPVTHVASGGLYGLATDTVPSDDLVEAIKPNTFVQMAPGGKQLPNGEPTPAGDALVVAPEAARAGAKVVVRMPDWYPNFPYRWVSWDDWLNAVDTQVKAVQASHATNIAAYELWNEPDWTWNTAAAGSFNDGWTRTFREVRSLDPTMPIQGPSYSDNIGGMQSFLQNAVATGTVPDIISWHELESSGKIAGDVATVRNLEASLGIAPRPISIEEYATTAEVGVPGSLVGYISKFERYGIHDAELAFWNHYGTLGDTLTDTGAQPNGAYWLYRWYGDMSGNMVVTTPPAPTGLDGAAAVTGNKKQVSAIFGGGSGSTAVRVDGLDKLALGGTVHAKLEYTQSFGRTNPVAAPITISDTIYRVKNGSITVPVAMSPANGYHLVITSGGTATDLENTYQITNLNSGLALDAQPRGMLVDQAAVSGRTSQRWRLVSAGSGLYQVVNGANGLVLGLKDASTGNGAPAVVERATGANDQLWQVVPDGKGHDKLVSYDSGQVLAVDGASKDAGARIVQWDDGSVTSDTAVVWSTGRIGNALELSGDNEYVTVPQGAVSGLTGDFTVSAWVDPTKDTTWQRLFDFGTGTSNYMFLTLNKGTGLRFAITTNGGGAEQQISSTTSLPLNTWSLVTVTVSGTTGTLYVNGQVVGTNPNVTLHPSDLGNTNQNWIGRSQYPGDPYLAAAVDDFTVYGRALTAADVAALASGQVGAGDVLHYPFDEATGATAADSSGNGRDATIVTTPRAATSDASTPDHFWTLTPRR
ncbi:LamG-like jellyroll fold domain-containing protein [Rugosimonospora africana]|nr:LamG-like jellyroll fold domain-containing protein [Rugosimonospora africana]